LLLHTRTEIYIYIYIYKILGASGSVALKALCYNRNVAGSIRHKVNFSVYLGPGIYSASNRNEYQKQKNNVSGE
jgi:hypothetical protein